MDAPPIRHLAQPDNLRPPAGTAPFSYAISIFDLDEKPRLRWVVNRKRGYGGAGKGRHASQPTKLPANDARMTIRR